MKNKVIALLFAAVSVGIFSTAAYAQETETELSTEQTTETEMSEKQEAETEEETEEETEVNSLTDLKIQLENEIKDYPGKYAIYVKNLKDDASFSINENPMVSASLIKLYVAGSYFENGADPNYQNDLHIMISESNNDATNRLITLLGDGDPKKGEQVVTDFAHDHGFESSQLNRLMLEQVPVENYTSVTDCGTMLEQVLNKEYVSEEASDRIMDALKDQQTRYKIPAGLPEGVVCANKTGELSDVENDVAIIWPNAENHEEPYILCVMTNEVPDVYAAHSNIAHISSIVYQYIVK